MYLFLFSIVALQACKDENIDPRDKFVGTWHTSAVGSLSYVLNGAVIATYPENFENTEELTKYGTEQISFGGTVAIYTGSAFKFSNETQSVTANGITTNITRSISGQYANDKIILTVIYTGTFTSQSAPGTIGTLTGNQVITYTKTK